MLCTNIVKRCQACMIQFWNIQGDNGMYCFYILGDEMVFLMAWLEENASRVASVFFSAYLLLLQEVMVRWLSWLRVSLLFALLQV